MVDSNLSVKTILQDNFINELNDRISIITFSCVKYGKFIQLYSIIGVNEDINIGSSLNAFTIATIKYKPETKYVLGTFKNNIAPYNIVNNTSFWLSKEGKILLYGNLPKGSYFMCAEYISQ